MRIAGSYLSSDCLARKALGESAFASGVVVEISETRYPARGRRAA